jgi:phage major head subunit gpT-like protein
MAFEKITAEGVIGTFFLRLAQDLGDTWIPKVSRNFPSTQEIETYGWLGQVPGLREWIGGRQPKGLSEKSYQLRNAKYEGTLRIAGDDIRRDKTGQVNVRLGEFSQRANAHWMSLFTTLLENAQTAVCYDGQYFFDTDHSEGSSGTQSNLLSVSLATFAVTLSGLASQPSYEQMQLSILKAIRTMLAYKDDQGEPMNENMREFLVMAPINLWMPAAAAIKQNAGVATLLPDVLHSSNLSITVVPNARLTWTEDFAVFATGGDVAALIAQEEVPLQTQLVGPGSELYFKEDCWDLGVWASRAAGYGYWQRAVKVKMANC